MFKKKFLPIPLILLFLVPTTVFATGDAPQVSTPTPANSLQILINGVPIIGPFEEGMVIPQERSGVLCGNPTYHITAGTDIQRVKIGPRDDGTCNLEIKTLAINDTPFPTDPGDGAPRSA